MKVKSSIKGYWFALAALVILQIIFQLTEHESLMIACIGILFLITVFGFAVESEKFTGYYKKHYPNEYKEMLKAGRFKAQLEFSPRGDNILKTRQQRLKKYFKFAICVFCIMPISIILISILRLII